MEGEKERERKGRKERGSIAVRREGELKGRRAKGRERRKEGKNIVGGREGVRGG